METTIKDISNDFGEGFVFSSQMMEVDVNDIGSYIGGEQTDTEKLSYFVNISVFKSEKYRKIICISRQIPTFDSSDREYDSWHDLYLLQEKNGIIRAVYCTGGYCVSRIEGYAEVYKYPEYLKKYFK